MRLFSRRTLRALLNPWLVRVGASPDYKIENTLVVTGAPRSGTTWLAEVIACVPRTALLFEPLNVQTIPEAKAAGLITLNYFEPGEVWPEGEVFFERLLRGKVCNWWTTSAMKVSRTIRPQRWVVKFVRANLLLGWLTSYFPIRLPALLVRHPCATIASRLVRGWSPMIHKPSAQKFFLAHPDLKLITERLTDPVEYLAALWCIETYAPLALPQPYPFHLMCYESLVRDVRQQLEMLCNHWNLEMSDKMIEQLHRPSHTTKKKVDSLRRGDSLIQWRKELSDGDVQRILRVVRAFGLDFYSYEVEPDYDRLYQRLHASSAKG